MSELKYFSELVEIIRDTVGDYDSEIKEETVALEVDGWDSVSHANLIIAVENHFEIRMTEEQIFNLKNVGMFAEVVEQLIEAKKE